jgi:hypothetical protein
MSCCQYANDGSLDSGSVVIPVLVSQAMPARAVLALAMGKVLPVRWGPLLTARWPFLYGTESAAVVN